MENLVLNKDAKSSSFVAPYQPKRAVDGSIAPVRRWLSNQVPCWISVDLGDKYHIGRWQVSLMGSAGWSQDHNISDFKLQGSMDESNWFDIDTVSGNTDSVVQRDIKPVQVRYIRVLVRRGLNINPQLASIVELAVYKADVSSAYLSDMTLSDGRVIPGFSPTKYSYTVKVDNSVEKIGLTPIAEDSNATIKVDGSAVNSGDSSPEKQLSVGDNNYTVEVISAIGGKKETYTVNVIREGNTYLDNLEVTLKGKALPLTPPFDKNTNSYDVTVSTAMSSVTISASPEDNSSTVTIDPSNPVSLDSSDTQVKVKVTAPDRQERLYIVNIHK